MELVMVVLADALGAAVVMLIFALVRRVLGSGGTAPVTG
jgi:hypothetical protein